MNPLKRQTMPCTECGGTGTVTFTDRTRNLIHEEIYTTTCPVCWGTRQVPEPNSAYITRLQAEIERLNRKCEWLVVNALLKNKCFEGKYDKGCVLDWLKQADKETAKAKNN